MTGIDNLKRNKLDVDILIGVLLFLTVFISKVNILSLPYHWDELGAYIRPTHWLAHGSLLRIIPGLHPPDRFFGHPPVFYLSLAALFKMAGEEMWISHVFVVVFSFLAVYFTYLLGCHLCNRATGILASLFLFFTPLYFAQSGMATPEPLVTALGVMCVYFFLRRRYRAYLLLGFFAVMVKETSAAVIAAILIYFIWNEENRQRITVRSLQYAAPLLALLIFFFMQKIATGMFLPNPYFKSHPFVMITRESLKWGLYSQNRIILTCAILANFAVHKKAIWKKEFTLFLLILLFYIGTFTFIYFLPRYILSTLPFFCLLGAYSVVSLFNDVKIQLVIAAIVLVSFLIKIHGTGTGYGSFETDMQYVDVVTTHKESCRYVEENFPEKHILALWSLSLELTEPYLGYVKKPIQISSFQDSYDVILYTPQGSRENEKLRELIGIRNMPLDRRFEKNGKYVEVYVSN
jgi:4-amino-4-deoxy-L-arabinose transferase-like glycosyltransferase